MSEQGSGTAFPHSGYGTPGMTLRDYFAGQALVSMGMWLPPGVTIYTDGRNTLQVVTARAEWAYAQADAMLKAREPKRSEPQP